MTKREKIIVAAAFLSVLYGIYFYLQDSAPSNQRTDPKSAAVREEITQLQTELYTELARVKLAEDDNHMLTLLKDEKRALQKGPFLPLRSVPSESAPSKEAQKKRSAPEKRPELKHRPIYSGFIESDGKKIAILDGMEYEAGEELVDDPGVKIQTIDPDKVVVEYFGAAFPVFIESVEDLKENFIKIQREESGPKPGADNGE